MTTINQIELGKLAALHIQAPQFEAKILLQGGQLMAFSTQAYPDNWLWASNNVAYKTGQAVRGGIPVCFPLFGNYAENPDEVRATFDTGLTKHGVARTSMWKLLEQDLTDEKAIVTLGWQVPSSFTSQYPQIKLRAKLVFELSETGFSLSLKSQNLGEQMICLTQAFHTYLPTDDIRQTIIQGFDNSWYVDMLKNSRTVEQVGDITFEQEVDRIYEASPKILLKAPRYQTTLRAKNSLSTVIWNPWIKKSKSLDQFAPNDFETMVCIETGNVGKDFVRLEANERKILSVSVTI